MKKVRLGVVVSDKMEKTISVLVSRKVMHPIYKKNITKSKKFMTHDERMEAKIGDTVKIEETRPLSKMKRWRLVEIVKKAV